MIKAEKVIQITKNAHFEKILDDIRDGLRDGTIENCIILANQILPNEARRVHRYWWGDKTSTYILGLLEYMKAYITDYMLNSEDIK